MKKTYNKPRNSFDQFRNIFQYVYSNVYPEVYFSTKRRGFDLRSIFHLVFKTNKDKKRLEQSGKNPQNYTIERNESFVFKQKPIEIDTFNDEEEEKIKERVEKRKKKRQEVAEKNKALKQQKNAEKEKEDEKELWARLKTLNEEFNNRNLTKKKRQKKCQK